MENKLNEAMKKLRSIAYKFYHTGYETGWSHNTDYFDDVWEEWLEVNKDVND